VVLKKGEPRGKKRTGKDAENGQKFFPGGKSPKGKNKSKEDCVLKKQATITQKRKGNKTRRD